LIDKDCFLTIGDMLKAEDFYSEQNMVIFEVIFDLYRLNKPIDLITVKEKLDDRKLLDKI
jgi:replicative DNA helicase